MAHLILTRGQVYSRRGGRIISGDLKIKVGVITMSVLIIGFLGVVSFSYLTVSNKQVTKGYEINQLKAEKASLIESKEDIILKVDEATAISTIQVKAYDRGMVSSEKKITYIEKKDEVAVR